MNLNKIKNKTTICSNGCWEWNKSCNSAGYGQFTENKVYWLAHRYAYACNLPLEKTDVVRHKCHNPKCCNPDHLELGSHKDNWHDSIDIHTKASTKRRKTWTIEGVTYNTIREAAEKTGLTMHSLTKYTDQGVFQTKKYRKACKIANKVPKI